MPTMKGIGSLQSERDLLAKLQHDLDRMRKDPTDVFAAFDFFVTAYHMLDWVVPLPPKKDPVYPVEKARQDAIVAREPRLQIAGHLANSAKHFSADRWGQVSATFEIGGHFHPNYWAKGHWAGHFPEPRLVIRLSAAGAALFNGETELNALDTAEKLYAFWAGEIS
jgi:hypothetical protein